MNWTNVAWVAGGLVAAAALAGAPRRAFHYAAKVPPGFEAARPRAQGGWPIGKTGLYSPFPDEVAHFASTSGDVRVTVRSVEPAPFASVHDDPAAWAAQVLARAAADQVATGPRDAVRAVTATPPRLVEGPAGRSATASQRHQLSAGAIDLYLAAAERDGRVVLVCVAVTGARPVAAVRAWLAAFQEGPLGLAADPAQTLPEAPPVTPERPPRNNQ